LPLRSSRKRGKERKKPCTPHFAAAVPECLSAIQGTGKGGGGKKKKSMRSHPSAFFHLGRGAEKGRGGERRGLLEGESRTRQQLHSSFSAWPCKSNSNCLQDERGNIALSFPEHGASTGRHEDSPVFRTSPQSFKRWGKEEGKKKTHLFLSVSTSGARENRKKAANAPLLSVSLRFKKRRRGGGGEKKRKRKLLEQSSRTSRQRRREKKKEHSVSPFSRAPSPSPRRGPRETQGGEKERGEKKKNDRA